MSMEMGQANHRDRIECKRGLTRGEINVFDRSA